MTPGFPGCTPGTDEEVEVKDNDIRNKIGVTEGRQGSCPGPN